MSSRKEAHPTLSRTRARSRTLALAVTRTLTLAPALTRTPGVLVMELLGPSLDELCQRIAPYTYLSGPTVMRVGRGALSPLHQLHVAGYVHNDVKPGNLLLGLGLGLELGSGLGSGKGL